MLYNDGIVQIKPNMEETIMAGKKPEAFGAKMGKGMPMKQPSGKKAIGASSPSKPKKGC
jgi:hypothetical protein